MLISKRVPTVRAVFTTLYYKGNKIQLGKAGTHNWNAISDAK